VLEIDDEGVRRPAGWPRRTSRLLRWDDLAAVCAWSQGVEGRHHVHHLTFLPRGDADHAMSFQPPDGGPPPPGAEILAIKVRGVPGVPEPRWSFPVGVSWDRTVEEVVAAVRRHRDVPFADRRDGARSARTRPPRRRPS
jgi:hypothetical protein